MKASRVAARTMQTLQRVEEKLDRLLAYIDEDIEEEIFEGESEDAVELVSGSEETQPEFDPDSDFIEEEPFDNEELPEELPEPVDEV